MDRRVSLIWYTPTKEKLIKALNVIQNLTDDEKLLFEKFYERILLNRYRKSFYEDHWIQDWRTHTEYPWKGYITMKPFAKRLGLTESELHFLIYRIGRPSLNAESLNLLQNKLQIKENRNKVKSTVKWALEKMLDDYEFIDLMGKYNILECEDYNYDYESEKGLSQGEKNKRYIILDDSTTH